MTVFRAYDVRGVYGTEFTEDIAKRVGKALGSYLPEGRIALGRDTRKSGPSVERAFLEGVLSTGCDVESYGVLPISIISFETWRGGLDAAAYISASHNPAEYNGIRFRTTEGYGMLYHKTEMMDLYEKGAFREGEGKRPTAPLKMPSRGTPITSRTNWISSGPSGSSWTWVTARPAVCPFSTRG